MKFVLRKSEADSPFSFVFQGKDDKMVLKSESYKQKTSAVNGIESVKKNCVEDDRYEFKLSKANKHYFNIKSTNGQIVATSAFFDTESEAKEAVSYLKRYCKNAETKEL